MEEETDGTCQTCHQRPGRLMIDPYQQDVNNETVPVVQCNECEQESIDSI